MLLWTCAPWAAMSSEVDMPVLDLKFENSMLKPDFLSKLSTCVSSRWLLSEKTPRLEERVMVLSLIASEALGRVEGPVPRLNNVDKEDLMELTQSSQWMFDSRICNVCILLSLLLILLLLLILILLLLLLLLLLVNGELSGAVIGDC